MGRYHAQPYGARSHVLVLLPECPWHPYLVEAVYHSDADCAIRH